VLADAGTVRLIGLIAGLKGAFDGGHEANVWHSKRLSGSEESSAASQFAHMSVVGKPNELVERAGDSGEIGDAAESDAKSVPKSSVSKMDTGERSGNVCFDSVSAVWSRKVEVQSQFQRQSSVCT
jgi:hypothetical protein